MQRETEVTFQVVDYSLEVENAGDLMPQNFRREKLVFSCYASVMIYSQNYYDYIET